jgi:hypothetical protein
MHKDLPKNIGLVFFLLCTCCIFLDCQKKPVTESNAIVSKKMLDAYTEVQYGNMPLIISVPHGGTAAPVAFPDRTCPGITIATDLHTIELVNAIDSVCKADYGFQPYLVISYLKRIKLDQNRDFPEASCSNTTLYRYWNDYHESIDTCIRKILAAYPQCLFIDLHGHGHTIQRLELGYLIGGNSLRNPSSIIPSSTSVYHLLQHNKTLSMAQLLSATNAFGTTMTNNGFETVPSAQIPAPGISDPFFDGGYNTDRYTNSAYPNVWGWQIETNYTGVRDSKNSYAAFAKAFLRSVMHYFSSNAGMQSSAFGK